MEDVKMEDGRWKMEDEEIWNLEFGMGKMEDGRLKIED